MLNGIVTRAPDGAKNIKLLQRGRVGFNGITSVDVATEEINLDKTVLYFEYTRGSSSVGEQYIMGSIIDSKTIRFVNTTADTDSGYIEWQLIQFNNVKSVQRGTTSAGPTTATINEVETTKSLLFTSYRITAAYGSYANCAGRLTNSTTINFYFPGGSPIFHWQLIEFK